MLSFLPAPIKGAISVIIFILNTVVCCSACYPFILIRMVSPKKIQRIMSKIVVGIAVCWVKCNSFAIDLMGKVNWDVQGLEGLQRDKSYLIFCNHRSWVDIIALQHILTLRIPFLRFFIKQELIYVPFLGGVWWGLDFPFMKRFSKEYLQKHPEKKGKDLETTRKACQKFKGTKVSILNYLEGTRFTPQKHEKTKSPYRHLLAPKTGGVSLVLDLLGEEFDSILNITMAYPYGTVGLWGMLSGQLKEVIIRIEKIPIPQEFIQKNKLDDSDRIQKMRAWIFKIWEEKDILLGKLLNETNQRR